MVLAAEPAETPALGGGWNAHGLAILGHRAARDLDALTLQQIDDAVVAERLSGRLRPHQVTDARAHRLGRHDHARRARGQRRGEEILQLEDAARRGDVLVGGDAAHRALVQLGGDGDIAQDERLQGADAVAEEAVLLLHDLARDFQDGRGALLERLHQPVGRLEALGDEIAIGLGARALHQGRVVVAVDQHLGQRLGIELDEIGRAHV